MKAVEQYLPVALAVYYHVQGGSHLSLWRKSQSATIQMKASEQYFPVVLFIMLYKVVLTFSTSRLL